MKQRVIEIIERKKLTPSRFADKIGVPRSTISHIISGRNKPSLELISKIADCFPEINLDWLIKGKGSMLQTQTSLFDYDTEPGERELIKTTSGPDDKKEKPSVKTTDVDDVQYGIDKRKAGEKKESKETTSQLNKDVVDISMIIMVYSDNSFEVLHIRK